MTIEHRLYDNVTQLALKKRHLRRQIVIDLLDRHQFAYQHHIDVIEGFYPQNIVVPASNPRQKVVIGAHYDNVPRSCGANDNASGVAVLLELMQHPFATQLKESLEFAFFDLEEGQCFGSRAYVKSNDVSEIALMINVDTVGYGDTVIVSTSDSKFELILHSLTAQLDLVKLVNLLPPSDDVSFMAGNVPTVSLCVVPNDDVPLMQEIAPLLLDWQRPKRLPKVLETIHNRPLDKLETVSGQSMKLAFDFVVHFLNSWKGSYDG